MKEFRVTKALHIDPTYLVIVEAGQKIIDRLDFAFFDRVRVILSERYHRFLALIFRRHYQRGRRSTGRGISQFIHRYFADETLTGTPPQGRIQTGYDVTQPSEKSK